MSVPRTCRVSMSRIDELADLLIVARGNLEMILEDLELRRPLGTDDLEAALDRAKAIVEEIIESSAA